MSNKVIKITSYVIFGLSLLIILHFFVIDVGKLNIGLAEMQDLSPDMKIAATETLADSWGGLILNFSLFLAVLSLATVIGFVIWQLIKLVIEKPKKARNIGIAILVAAGVIALAYSLASDEIPNFLGSDQIQITNFTVRVVETSLYVMYIIFAISIIAAIYSEVSKLWK